MPELSVIIPFANEYPQILFTIQNIAQELLGRVDFEIVTVSNFCEELKEQGVVEDKGYEVVSTSEKINPWLKVLKYTDKLSHWNAKNVGVANASGKFLWFCDAHCIVSRGSLYRMFKFYKKIHKELNGTVHLPLTYKLLESRKLVYKLVYKRDTGEVHYSFTGYKQERSGQFPYYSYQVPCMSTCGMMMTKDMYTELGGWPKELGIYGGGENFLNFALAVTGKTINIFHGEPLFHHGEKRSYSYNYDDYSKNRIIATYLFGGKKLATLYTDNRKGNKEVLQTILKDVLVSCEEHRKKIKQQQTINILEWTKEWI